MNDKEKSAHTITGLPYTKYLNVAHANQEKAIAFNIASYSQHTEVKFTIFPDRIKTLKVIIPKL
jgi:hypothetical protein